MNKNFFNGRRKRGKKNRRKTRKKRGGDDYFNKIKKMTKQFFENEKVVEKLENLKYNLPTDEIDNIINNLTEERLNEIIKAYSHYLETKRKPQKGGDGKELMNRLQCLQIQYPEEQQEQLEHGPEGGQEDNIPLIIQTLETIINRRTAIRAQRLKIDLIGYIC